MNQAIEYIKNIFDSQNIPAFLLKQPYDNICDVDFTLKQHIYNSTEPYEPLMIWLEESCHPGNIYVLHDYLELYNVVFIPPEAEPGTYFVAGPYRYRKITEREVYDIMGKTECSSAMKNRIFSFYNNVTVTFSQDKFESLLVAVLSPFLGEETRIYSVDMNRELREFFVSEENFASLTEDDPSLTLLQNRYDIQNEMLEAVRQMDAERAVSLHRRFIQFNVRPSTTNALRNMKNMNVIFNTLLRRTAEECQVHPYYIDAISRKYAIEIESCTNDAQVHDLAQVMIRKYCLLIQNHSMKGYSMNVQKSMIYIETHYAEALSLAVLARYLNLSTSYLSALFKREVDMTVMEYICQTRIKHALILLNSTQLPIQDIAAECGFTDLNYFSRVFKKKQGTSPSQYRKLIQR